MPISNSNSVRTFPVPSTDIESNISSRSRDDEQLLAHFGKRQHFKRNIGLMSALGLGSTLSLTWEGSLAGIDLHMLNGGSAGAIAAVPIITIGVLLQIIVMAELASMIPLCGGAYNWIAILSPKCFANFLSYVTGWALVIAWQAASASVAWLTTEIILALAQLNYPSYSENTLWHFVLVFYAVIVFAILFTTALGRIFPGLEAAAFVLHTLGFFVILIIIVYLAPKTDPSIVFGTFINGGGFTSDAQSAIVGSVGIMFGFSGIDASIHMAEEVENATTTIPRALIMTVVISGVTAWAMLIAIFFCQATWTESSESSSPIPFISILLEITGSRTGTTILVSVILVLAVSGSIGTMATASRMLWAFAREDGVPFSKYISKVDSRSALPLCSIGVTATFSVLVALLNFGSRTAFQALLSLTVASFYSSFILAASIMLYRRLSMPADAIKWGPFRLGRAGVPVTILALLYSVVGFLFSFWPYWAKFDLETFNWSSVVFSGVLILAMAWWACRARFTYKGPKMEIELKD